MLRVLSLAIFTPAIISMLVCSGSSAHAITNNPDFQSEKSVLCGAGTEMVFSGYIENIKNDILSSNATNKDSMNIRVAKSNTPIPGNLNKFYYTGSIYVNHQTLDLKNIVAKKCLSGAKTAKSMWSCDTRNNFESELITLDSSGRAPVQNGTFDVRSYNKSFNLLLKTEMAGYETGEINVPPMKGVDFEAQSINKTCDYSLNSN